jgi:cobalt-zinc-cadmium efflux system membrane fusion protein
MKSSVGKHALFILGALFAAGVIVALHKAIRETFAVDTSDSQSQAAAPAAQSETIELSSSQVSAIKIEPVGTFSFSVEKEAVGNIDFDEDLSVQVFSSYQGKILKALVDVGDAVQKGQALYTIDSPDLVQAESTLIGAAATYDLTTKELARVRSLYGTNGDNGGIAQKDLEQAISDQETAEGALKAARDAVRVFGKSDAEIDQLVATRKIDPVLVVCSPISGKTTARDAQPGLLVQPGNVPAPFTVSDLSTKWMIANVDEHDSPLFHAGQPVQVKVMAYPDRVFEGKVSKIYATVDPNTHRVTVRSEISDPNDELRPGMLADFIIRVSDPTEATAIPVDGAIREGDGTWTAWVTTDGSHFSSRTLKLGIEEDGRYQVLEGLKPGEQAVTEGGIFLSNMLEAPPSD